MTKAERIKAARKGKGLTQKELGEALKVTQTTVQQYESGKRNPKHETLQRIAAALGVSEGYLHGRVDDPDVRLATQADFDNFGSDKEGSIAANLSDDELEMIYKFKGLPAEHKILIQADIRMRYLLYVEYDGDLTKFRKHEFVRKILYGDDE